jgi:HEAT repeat protein
MGFERSKHHGLGHFRVMEKSGDTAGLLAALNDPAVVKSAKLTSGAIVNLRRLGSFDAAPAVAGLLAPDRPTLVRRTAAKALGAFQNPVALPALRRALDDPSTNVRIWASRSLGELKDRESLYRLIERLDDENATVRVYAAEALGEIGDQRSTEPLIACLGDRSRTMRLTVIRALVSLRDPRGLPALEKAGRDASLLRRRPYVDGARELSALLS